MLKLDENGIIYIGLWVELGDILVGKFILKGEFDYLFEGKLLWVIFGEKLCDVRNILLKLLYGVYGWVLDVKIFFWVN